MNVGLKEWCEPGLNWRHMDFQSKVSPLTSIDLVTKSCNIEQIFIVSAHQYRTP